MRRRFLAVLGSLVLVISTVAGCGGSGAPSPENASLSADSASENVAEASENDPEEAAAAEEDAEEAVASVSFDRVELSGNELPEGASEPDVITLKAADVLQTFLEAHYRPEDTDFGNYRMRDYDENVREYALDWRIPTEEGKTLIAHLVYNDSISPDWHLSAIQDADTGQYYYAVEGIAAFNEVFDYQTGERLVQAASQESTDGSFERVNENIFVQMEENIDSFREMYLLREEEAEAPGGLSGKKAGSLTFRGMSIFEFTEKEMEDGYSYIKDVTITADEEEGEIDIAILVPPFTTEDTAMIAGEDVARQLSKKANIVDDAYQAPGTSNLGGLFEYYNLLIYVEDGLGSLKLWGTKNTDEDDVVWRGKAN